MKRHATPKAPKEDTNKLRRLCFDWAGPYPNITGMKNLYWGEDAYCVRCGRYVFKVDFELWTDYMKLNGRA